MTVKIDALRSASAPVRSHLRLRLAAARSWLGLLRLTVNLRRILACVAVMLVGAWWLTPSGEPRGEGAELRAELAETRDALRTARETLRLRARAIEMAESEIEALTQELRQIRAAAAHDAEAPVLAADNPWRTRVAR